MSSSPTSAERTLFERVWLDGRLEEHLDAVYHEDECSAAFLWPADGASLTYTKLALARAAGRVNRAAGRGGGTAAPGRLLLRMAPRAIATLAGRLRHGVTLISATNGKTTSARMLASILEAAGHAVVHNRAGANTNWGVATALAERDGEVGVFEVDEAWLPLLAAQVKPQVVVLGNLSRDRLDGYGELQRLISLWRSMLQGRTAPDLLVANADDPLLAGPGGVLEGVLPQTILFGIADKNAGFPVPEHPHEAHSCAVCGGPLEYARAFVGHLGHYHCPRCGGARPVPSVAATVIADHGMDGMRVAIYLARDSFAVRLRQPGLHNVHNALAATAAAVALGVDPPAIREGLESSRTPFGRSEKVDVMGRTVHLCLVKNPAGVNATLRVLRQDNRAHPLHLWLALNDGRADGRDVSWIWDADFEGLRGLVAGVTCSGRRAHELALRVKYAGLDCHLEVDENLDRSFGRALAGATTPLIAMPTYSALLEMRGVLNRRGISVSDWATSARSST